MPHSTYYFRLRILANASAKAGNYEWESKVEKDSKVIFAPLDVNLDYADFASRTPRTCKGSKQRKVQQTLGKFAQQNSQSHKGGKGGGGKGVKHASLAKGGKTICRAFNLGQCKDPCPYGGAHVCSIAGCGLKHPSARRNHSR